MLQVAPPPSRAYTYEVTVPAVIPTEFRDLVKLNARIRNSDDALVDVYLGAAIDYFEKKSGRDLFTKTYRTFRDFFPAYLANEGYYQTGIGFQTAFSDNNSFLIRKSKLQAVSEIDYFPIVTPTVPVIISTDVYYVSAQFDYSEILTQVGQEWPCDLVLPQEQSIRITFTCGYGSLLSDIPQDIQLGIMAYVSWAYENRGDCCEDSNVPMAMRNAVRCNKIILV